MAKPKIVQQVPLKEKLLLNVYEAAAYSGIGIHRIEAMLREPDCTFVASIGNRKLVKRELFEEFVRNSKSF